MKAVWQSRREFAHEVERYLAADTVEFDIFGAVSDNRRRWLSIEHVRARVGYDPDDEGERFDGRPRAGRPRGGAAYP